ncbi:MAG: S-layer homology domain-containing protein [Clostridiales bacterium]|jgi:hypothetical protein|nr:S-layer homology domain-containing protein [Clostridiales bacterium]
MKAKKLKAMLGAILISTILLASMTSYADMNSTMRQDKKFIFNESCDDDENLYVPNKPSKPEKPELPSFPIFPNKPNVPEMPEGPEVPSKPVSHLPYIKGYEDGTFRAERPLTREEMATMIARLLLNGAEPDEEASFEDIAPTRYSNKYIGYLEKLGIVSGYSDGTFRPYESVTRSEFASMIIKVEAIQGKAAKRIEPYEDKYLTRVEAVLALNEVFGRECSDAHIPNLFSDLDESNSAYNDILFAAVEHTHNQ